jgi:transcription antitermination factor NusG
VPHDAAEDQNWQAGQQVRVKRGPFREFVGKLAAVDAGAQTARVELSLFNRPSMVELKLADIEAVSSGGGPTAY